MTNLEKIKRLNELQRKIEKIQEEMYYVKHAKKLRFIHYVSSGRCGVEDHEKSKMIDPSSTLLSNVKEITLKILNEEMKDLSKEVKSIKTNDKDTQILITKLADELNKKMKDINKEDEDDKKIYNDIMKQTEEIMKNIKKPQTQKDIIQKEIKEYEQDKVKNTDKALDMIYYSSSELRDIDKEISKPNISKDKLIQLQVKLMNIKYPDDDEILKTVRPYLLYIIKFKLSKLSDQYRR